MILVNVTSNVHYDSCECDLNVRMLIKVLVNVIVNVRMIIMLSSESDSERSD